MVSIFLVSTNTLNDSLPLNFFKEWFSHLKEAAEDLFRGLASLQQIICPCRSVEKVITIHTESLVALDGVGAYAIYFTCCADFMR